jgi:hypothetical protein
MRYVVLTVSLFVWSCGSSREPLVRPDGAAEKAATKALEGGAKSLQRNAPAAALDVYMVGFHPMRSEPSHQMEAHHFCRQVNEDFAQCVLFDGNTAEANLNGIEYIISEKLFETLAPAERQYWHPHNYEILSGQLQAPGLPAMAEKEFLRRKMNSYGKTWHVWQTARGDKLPLGDPMLAWSFNRDGEIRPELQSRFEERFSPVMEKRGERQELTAMARPQEGVDALNGKFGRPTQPLPGVRAK